MSVSVRSHAAGGVVAAARSKPLGFLQRHDRVTLLIHGFAVTQPQALREFRKFRSALSPFDRNAVNIYWPGDAGIIGFTQASYPFQRRRALDAVTELDRFINNALSERSAVARRANRAPRPLELKIVAHSLGCLVALELLQRLNRDELRVRQLVLMAAAVPRYRLRDRDLGHVFEKVDRVKIYYSLRDWVLALAFPLGELPHIPFPESYGIRKRIAVGRYGCGQAFGNVEEEERYCGHSGYWPDPSIAASVRDDVRLPQGNLPRTFQGRTVDGRRLGRRGVKPRRR